MFHYCLDCGGRAALNVTVGAVDFGLCEICAQELRDKLIGAVGAPED